MDREAGRIRAAAERARAMVPEGAASRRRSSPFGRGPRVYAPLCDEDFIVEPKTLRIRHATCAERAVCPKVLEDLYRGVALRIEIANHLSLSTRVISAFFLR